jgi:signal transduction histidine kinase
VRVTGTGAQDGAPAVLVLDDISQHVSRAATERLFVQNAAHQLRTPLAGIANAVELLQAGAKEDPVARDRFLAHLERETHRLSRLARALLVLARAQSGVQAPRLDFVELEPVLKRIVDRLDVRREVTVHVSCAPTLAAFAEPDLLEEALAALAENAVRHTYRGTITLRGIARDDGNVDIEVEDSGEGILPEHQELLFDPFFRAAADGDGFGLGLSIAAQAIAALGATLTLDSSPQRGSRFSFRLPAAEVVTA